MLCFRLLGPLEISFGEKKLAVPRGPKVRTVLALLLCRAGQPVPTSRLVDELWGENPPDSALGTVRTHVYHLRRLLEEHTGEPRLLETTASGYVLNVAPEQVDAVAFLRAADRARDLLAAEKWSESSALLRSALDLWRGPDALADVGQGALLAEQVAHLQEARMRTLQQWIGAETALGHQRELVPELRSLVTAHPLNEWLHAQLIDALSRSGRRPEALTAYQHLRRVLADELGLEPSLPLQRLQRQILCSQEAPPTWQQRAERPAPPGRPARTGLPGRAFNGRAHDPINRQQELTA